MGGCLDSSAACESKALNKGEKFDGPVNGDNDEEKQLEEKD